MIEDGNHDAFVVDANHEARDGVEVLVLDLTIVSGPHKGEVVAICGPVSERDPIELLGLPGTLVVNDGVLSFRVED